IHIPARRRQPIACSLRARDADNRTENRNISAAPDQSLPNGIARARKFPQDGPGECERLRSAVRRPSQTSALFLASATWSGACTANVSASVYSLEPNARASRQGVKKMRYRTLLLFVLMFASAVGAAVIPAIYDNMFTALLFISFPVFSALMFTSIV